jgi:hypothetical protein
MHTMCQHEHYHDVSCELQHIYRPFVAQFMRACARKILVEVFLAFMMDVSMCGAASNRLQLVNTLASQSCLILC